MTKRGICNRCRREVDLEARAWTHVFVMRRHGIWSTGNDVCSGSETSDWAELDAAPRLPLRVQPGVGKRGKAGCGHPGEHVTTELVICDVAGCDGLSPYGSLRDAKPRNLWECTHAVKVRFSGTTSCRDCGKLF